MTVSNYFNQFNYFQEQNLLDQLVMESIKIYGQDMIFCPRRIGNLDTLLNEDSTSYYQTSYQIEMYVKSIDGFNGDTNFVSKFGFEIRDRVTFTIARLSFEENVGRFENSVRPNEGDIIYFPLNKKCFQIKFVDDKPFFYQFGKLQMFDVTCELFEYSSEVFNTGIPEIDSLQNKYSLDTFNWDLSSVSGKSIIAASGASILSTGYNIEAIDVGAQNDVFETDANQIVDNTEENVFGYT